MKIPLTNYDIQIFNRLVKRDVKENILTQLVKLQQYRIRQDIQKWRYAIQIAEQIYYPTRYQLYQTYRDAVLDAHLSGLIDQRIDSIILKKFTIKVGDKEDEVLTEIFKGEWFLKFLTYSMESIFWGYSLVQFGDADTNKGFNSVDLVPRINVRPEREEFVVQANEPTGKSYVEPPYSDFALGIGDRYNLGLLMKASFYTITKNSALGIWSEFAELYGIPPRILKTNVRDDTTRRNGEKMMENMSRSSWAVIDYEDDITFGAGSGGTDSSAIFAGIIQECNEELSKLIMGHSAAADSTSGKLGNEQQANDIGADKQELDSVFIKYCIQDKLFPFMRNLGFKIPDNAMFEWDNTEQDKLKRERAAEYGLKLAQMISTFNSVGYEFDQSKISELLDMNIVKKVEPTNAEQAIKSIKNHYNHVH